MAIEKKLVHFRTLAKFEEKLAANEILDTSIVFIKDRKLIWTHGTYYALPNDEVFVSDGQEPTGNEEIWVDLSEDSPAVDIDLSNYVTKDELNELILDIKPIISYISENQEEISITSIILSEYGNIDNFINEFSNKNLRNDRIFCNKNGSLKSDPYIAKITTNFVTKSDGIILDVYILRRENNEIYGYRSSKVELKTLEDGTKALMNDGNYTSVALEDTKNVLKRIYIGVLNLIVGSNNSVNITNSNALSSINPFEWFTVTCNLNGSDTYLHAYSDNNIIKCFRHYTNQDNNRSIAFIISDINVADSTCNIVFNDNNLVTNSNISNYVLTKTNTIEYNPTSGYHPATKKYVDDRWFDINSLILELRKYFTPHDITEFVNKTYNSWDNLSYICRNRYLYRGRNVPVNVSYNIDGGIHLVIVQQNGSPHDEGKSYLYLEHFDIYKDLDETVKGYLVQSITLGKGDGAKALMDDGKYYKVVKEEDKMTIDYNPNGIVINNIQSDGSIDITVTEDQYNFIVKHKLHQHFRQSFLVNNRSYIADVYGYNTPLDYTATGKFYSTSDNYNKYYGNGSLWVKLCPQGNNRFTGYVTEFLLLKDDNS